MVLISRFSNKIIRASQLRLLIMLLSLLVISGLSRKAIAHSPHDDVFSVEISPNYERDKTIFALVWGALVKSEDGGDSWRRLVRNLDHKYRLFSLELAHDAQTLFVASLGDGVYKSEDSGETWFKANQGLTTLNIDRVTVAPNSTNLALATGTTGGLFLTRDGGANWKPLTGSFGKVTAFTFLPRNNNHILIGDRQGNLYLSLNGGINWGELSLPQDSGAVTAIAVSPSYPSDNKLIVGTEKGQIFTSLDGGQTFSRSNQSFSEQPILDLALSPSFANDGVAFASAWDKGAFCSTNRGLDWQTCDRGLTQDKQAQILGRPSFGSLSVSHTFATDKTVLLAGFDGLFKSTNGGRQWSELNTFSPLYIMGVALSPNYHEDSIIALTDLMWGAYLSRDSGSTWQAANQGVIDKARGNGLTCLFAIVFSPNFSVDQTMFTSTWYRLLKSTDGGKHWRQIIPIDKPWWEPKRHHAMTIAVSPNFEQDEVVFLGDHRSYVLKSRDRGESFDLVLKAKGMIGSLAISPNFKRDLTVFVGDTHGVHRSLDGGQTWDFHALVDSSFHQPVPISPLYQGEVAEAWQHHLDQEKSKALEVKLAISPNFATDGVIFAGTPNGLFKSGDGGINWTQTTDTPFGNRGYIEAVAVSPEFANDGMVLVSVRGKGLFRSDDGGKSFREVGQELIQNQYLLAQYPGVMPKVPPIVFSPNFGRDQTIYAFSNTKLFRSVDRGDHWHPVKAPKPKWSDQAYVRYLYYIDVIMHRPRRSLAIAGLLSLVIIGGVYGVIRRRRTYAQG